MLFGLAALHLRIDWSHLLDMLFDPSTPLDMRLDDSVRKGYLSASAAQSLFLTSTWVDENRESLTEKFPGLAICVVPDPTLGGGFATYVGGTGFIAESKARQFSPNVPYVLLDPAARISHYIGPVPMDVALLVPPLLEDGDKPGGKGGAKDDKGGDNPKDQPTSDEKKEAEEAEKLQEKNDKFISDTPEKTLAPLLKIKCSDVSGTPYAQGFIKIADGNCVFKPWAVDSQSSISQISEENFKRLEKKGAKFVKGAIAKGVKSTQGTGDYQKWTGVSMKFPRDDGSGSQEIVTCNEPFIVTNSDILGADQLKATGTRLIWDPFAGQAQLQKSPHKK